VLVVGLAVQKLDRKMISSQQQLGLNGGGGPGPDPLTGLDGLYSFSSQPKAFLAHKRKNSYLAKGPPSLIPVSR
jgi:hypothetical protein